MRVFLDIEGTGTQNSQIAQLAYIITDENYNVLEAKSYFFKVDDMNPFAQRLHGLSLEYLRRASNGDTFADRFKEIQHDLDGELLICHNTRSDFDLLALEYARLGETYTPVDNFCTMAHFKPICEIHDRSGRIKPPSLRELIEYHQLSDEEIAECATKLFKCLHVKPHDSRFDAAAIFLICRQVVSQDDFANHASQNLPARPAVIVPIAPKIKAKEKKAVKQKALLRQAKNAPFLAKWALPIVAALIILSLLLRLR